MSEHDAPTITELMTVNSRLAKNNRQLRTMNKRLAEALGFASSIRFHASFGEYCEAKHRMKAALAEAKEME